jgi:hypothetical protein
VSGGTDRQQETQGEESFHGEGWVPELGDRIHLLGPGLEAGWK